MSKIINLTPHAITFLENVPGEGEMVIASIPPSGTVARCAVTRERITEIPLWPEEEWYPGITGPTILVNRTVFGAVEGLPEPQEDAVYVVSAIAAQAVPHRQDVFIVDDAVRDDQGRIIGARALAHI